MSKKLSRVESDQSLHLSAKAPNRRADHIDYTEYIIRKTVQNNTLRGNIHNFSSKIQKDIHAHHKNLPLYLHHMTAELKRQKGSDKSIKQLFDTQAQGDVVRIFPNVPSMPTFKKSMSTKNLKRPDDPMTAKILADIRDNEHRDFFVIETEASEKKSKVAKTTRNKYEGSPEQRLQAIIREKLEDDPEDKLDKCYKEYSKLRTTQRLRQLGIEQAQSLHRGAKSPTKKRVALFNFTDPKVQSFFTTQDTQESSLEIAQNETARTAISKEQEDDEKILEDVCHKEKVKIAEFFNIEEEEFGRKYQNCFIDKIRKENDLSAPKWKSKTFNKNEKLDKIRMFDHMKIDENLKHFDPRGKKMMITAEIAKERQRNFLFDQYTITRGEQLNKQLNPQKNSKRRQQMIMQTKYRQDLQADDPDDKIRVEKVTLSTGSDPKLIRNVERLAVLFPKSSKNISSSLSMTGWWTETMSKMDLDEEQSMERITLEDDEKQVIEKIIKGPRSPLYEHSRTQSDRLGTTCATFRDSPKSSTFMRKTDSINDFKQVKHNKQATKEIKSIFNDFYDDLLTFTEHSKEENEDIDNEIAFVANEVGDQYTKIQAVHDREIVTNLAEDFIKLQKKNRFKHKLIESISNKVFDKKALVEEVQKHEKEEKIRQTLKLKKFI